MTTNQHMQNKAHVTGKEAKEKHNQESAHMVVVGKVWGWTLYCIRNVSDDDTQGSQEYIKYRDTFNGKNALQGKMGKRELRIILW